MNQQLKMLVVDSKSQTQKNLQQMVANWPMIQIVGAAGDGENALRVIERQRPDVVLMSTEIPVLDGFQTTQIIKALWSSVRVILFAPQATVRRVAAEAGADAFLVEGFSDEDLLRAVVQ